MGKIRLRHGDSEIELEGDEGFIERQLDAFYARFKIDPKKARVERTALLASPSEAPDNLAVEKPTTPAEYFRVHSRSHRDGVTQLLVFGRFLEKERGVPAFSPREINALVQEAKLPKDIHSQYFLTATQKGLLRSDGGKYSLTSTADEFLDSLSQGLERTPTARPAGSPKKAPSKSKSVEVEKFDPHKEGDSPSLEEFFQSKRPGTAAGPRIAVIAYYITKVKRLPTFSEGNVDYAYRLLKLSGRPRFLRQVIINNKNQSDLFDVADDGVRWELTRTGELLVEDKLPPNDE